MKKDKHLIGTDTAEKILSFLNENNYNHMVLYHSESRNRIFNETNSENKVMQYLQFSEDKENDISHFIYTTRKDLNIKSNQDVMIAISWVFPNEKTYFSLFPEVIFVDCVADTNSDKRPLLTLAGKDLKEKMFTIVIGRCKSQAN